MKHILVFLALSGLFASCNTKNKVEEAASGDNQEVSASDDNQSVSPSDAKTSDSNPGSDLGSPEIQPPPGAKLLQDGLYQILPSVNRYFEYNAEEEKKSLRYEALLKKINDGTLKFEDLSSEDQDGVEAVEQDGGYWDVNISPTVTWRSEFPHRKIRASSTLAPSGKTNYECSNLMDSDLRTVWSEGVKGNGIGEFIVVEYPAKNRYDQPTIINSVTFLNGFVKRNTLWANNGRVKVFKMYINDKPYALLALEDSKGYQQFSIGRIVSSQDIVLKFEIVDVYPGSKYEDVVLSYIDFYGEGVG